jgi:hypothetical protein
VQNLLGFDSLLSDDDCLIAIKIWSAPHLLPYIFVVDWGSRAMVISKHLVRQRAIFQVRGLAERPYSSLPEPDTFEKRYFVKVLKKPYHTKVRLRLILL